MIIGTGQVTESGIQIKLFKKYAELNSVDAKEQQKEFIQGKQDYFEVSSGKYDKNDYERVLEKFKSGDANIKAHEQSHASQVGTTAPIQYNYQMGPDGKMYAVGGSVRLDTSMPQDPKQAQLKLDQLKKSASSSSDMSSADSSIAISANLMKMKLNIQEIGN